MRTRPCPASVEMRFELPARTDEIMSTLPVCRNGRVEGDIFNFVENDQNVFLIVREMFSMSCLNVSATISVFS